MIDPEKRKASQKRANAKHYATMGPEQTAEYRWQLRYGLTSEARTALIAAQDGKCALCGQVLDVSNNWKTHVDHIHGTKIVRGILCHRCNKGIGFLNENPALLRKAAEYIEKEYPHGACPK